MSDFKPDVQPRAPEFPNSFQAREDRGRSGRAILHCFGHRLCGVKGVDEMARIALACISLLLLAAASANAANYSIGAIEIDNPWTRATPKGATVAGAYMTIRNKGNTSDRLVGGSAAVAGRFGIHRMEMEQGVAKMRPVEGGLEIKPGETVELKPGSLHVMLMGLKQPLQKGEKVKGTLELEKAGKDDIEYACEVLVATAPTAGEHQH